MKAYFVEFLKGDINLLKIKLNQMQFHAHIGVYQEERIVGQDVLINIELVVDQPDLEKLSQDELENTINYGPIYQLTKKIVSRTDIKLIETLATLIMTSIQKEYQDKLDNVIVSVKKKNLPIDGILDSAEVEVSAK